MTTIVPREIYLLETFSSVEYLTELRETWGEMVNHLEGCLERYMSNLPADHRNLPRSEQPDVAWGERVLPNFRATYDALCSGVISLSHGEASGLYSAHGPNNDFMGQREYSDTWLTSAERDRYGTLLAKSARMAANICATVEPYWEPGDFENFQRHFGPIDMPAALPAYRLNRGVTVKSEGAVKRNGVYLPDQGKSIAAFIHTEQPAPYATVLIGIQDILDENGTKYEERTETEEQSCVWTLVERDLSATAVRAAPSLVTGETRRIPGGDTCPATGYYFTPAKTGSRQQFQQGQIMPTLDSAYGGTIWQWDANQG